MIVKICGRKYNLVRLPQHKVVDKDGTELRGYCEEYHEGTTPKIVIEEKLRGREELEVILHELQHAGRWSMKEEFVEEFCDDVAKILWKLGYRKIKKFGESI